MVITVVLPPSSAECERTFSTLRQTKNYLRNTMGDEKLNDISILNIEREISKQLNIQEVVNKFAAGHKNRKIELI